MKSINKTLALVLLGAVVLALIGTSCNTTRGLGQDVEKLGDKIQEKSSR